MESGYWQVEMDSVDWDKIAFTLGTGLWKFTVMPFGLCNTPATFKRLTDNVFTGLLWKNCLLWCHKCKVCWASYWPQKKPRASMKQYYVGSPFQRMTLHISGWYPEYEHENKCILVATDYFRKWVEVYINPYQEVRTVADVLIREFISRFGVLLELHSDQGCNFWSELFCDMCKKLSIYKTRWQHCFRWNGKRMKGGSGNNSLRMFQTIKLGTSSIFSDGIQIHHQWINRTDASMNTFRKRNAANL